MDVLVSALAPRFFGADLTPSSELALVSPFHLTLLMFYYTSTSLQYYISSTRPFTASPIDGEPDQRALVSSAPSLPLRSLICTKTPTEPGVKEKRTIQRHECYATQDAEASTREKPNRETKSSRTWARRITNTTNCPSHRNQSSQYFQCP